MGVHSMQHYLVGNTIARKKVTKTRAFTQNSFENSFENNKTTKIVLSCCSFNETKKKYKHQGIREDFFFFSNSSNLKES